MWPIDIEWAAVWFLLADGLVLWTTESLRDYGLGINNDPPWTALLDQVTNSSSWKLEAHWQSIIKKTE